MNLVDISLVAEIIKENDIKSMKKILSIQVENSNIEVLKLLDVSLVQKEITSGNFCLLVRVCFEHPAKMIKSEIDEYSKKASNVLEKILDELLKSENKVFSIKSLVTKLL